LGGSSRSRRCAARRCGWRWRCNGPGCSRLTFTLDRSTGGVAMVQYVLLMRHGEPGGRQRASTKGEEAAVPGGQIEVRVTVDLVPAQAESGLSSEGLREVEEVARGLK